VAGEDGVRGSVQVRIEESDGGGKSCDLMTVVVSSESLEEWFLARS